MMPAGIGASITPSFSRTPPKVKSVLPTIERNKDETSWVIEICSSQVIGYVVATPNFSSAEKPCVHTANISSWYFSFLAWSLSSFAIWFLNSCNSSWISSCLSLSFFWLAIGVNFLNGPNFQIVSAKWFCKTLFTATPAFIWLLDGKALLCSWVRTKYLNNQFPSGIENWVGEKWLMLSFLAKSGKAFSLSGSSNLILFNIIKADINLVAYTAIVFVRFDKVLYLLGMLSLFRKVRHIRHFVIRLFRSSFIFELYLTCFVLPRI